MRPISARASGMRTIKTAHSTGAITATAAGSPNQPVATLIAAAVTLVAASTSAGESRGLRRRTS